MSKKCQVTGKIPQTGNNVSHANNRTKRKFFPNLHTHKFWVESENRFVNLKVSAKGMRIIDKKALAKFLKKSGLEAKKSRYFYYLYPTSWARNTASFCKDPNLLTLIVCSLKLPQFSMDSSIFAPMRTGYSLFADA